MAVSHLAARSADVGVRRPRESRIRSRALRRLLHDRAAMFAFTVLVLIVGVSLVGPWFALDPDTQVLTARNQGPSAAHWLGTDRFGRDTLARLISGGRVSLLGSAMAVGVGVGLGVPFGLIAGSGQRRLAAALNAISDTAMSVPPLLLAMVIVGIRGPGLTNAMLAVGVILAPRFFRVTRAQTKVVRAETYVEAERAAGCPPFRLLWRHFLPNVSGPIIVQVSFALGVAIVSEASLSFLGLGTQPPTASWGTMASEAFAAIRDSTFQLYPPAVTVSATILAMSVFGDGLRDAFGREQGSR